MINSLNKKLACKKSIDGRSGAVHDFFGHLASLSPRCLYYFSAPENRIDIL